MKKVNVLVSGSGSLYGVAIIQSLLRSGLDLKIVACDISARTLGVHLAHCSYIVPPVCQEERYLTRVLQVIDREQIDAIFVASSHELAFYSHHKTAIEEGTGARVFTNPPEILNVCRDKWLTICFLQGQGFYFPLTVRYPEDRNQLAAFTEKVQFPLVIKPRQGAGSQGVYIVKHNQELCSLLENKEDMIVQQYLPDACGEFTTGICCGSEGRVLSAITLKRCLQEGMTMSADGGEFTVITDYCKKVAQALKPYGPCNFQLRLLDGKPHIFEINPRFSSSTGMRVLLGVNEAEILIRAEIMGEEICQRQILECSVIRQYTDYLVPTEKITLLQQTGYIQQTI